MGSVDDILQLCRLCLVKDQVNIPIFDETSDIRQTFLKINSCLPVKVSRDDSLPKKICDGCSYKLDMLYVFRNTSVDSEKQLLSWLDQIGLSTNLMLQDQDAESEKPEVTVKQEALESSDRIEEGEDDNGDMGDDSHSYLMQQQKLPYQDFEFGEPSSSNTDLMGSDEPAPKRAKRAAAMKKHVSEETEEDELDAAMQITKAEDEDSDEIDNPDFGEEEIPSTSADDQDQPGPSGVGKGSIEAPSQEEEEEVGVNYLCNICARQFPSKNEFLKHHFHQYGKTFNCCKCRGKFKTAPQLYAHLEQHKTPSIEGEEEIIEEIVLNYENEDEGITDTNDLLYILEDSPGINEIVIEEGEVPAAQTTEEEEEEEKEKNEDNVAIVQLEHGYVIPNTADQQDEVVELVPLNKKPKKIIKVQPSTSKFAVISQTPRPRATPPKRRHVVPDFSSTNYLFISANEEVDIPHYKCLRCEQLFINKFVFSRHIEKGKCYINNCDVCSATFEKNSDFYQHYTIEHTDRAICNFCFRTFMYEKNVKEHMLRHLDQFRHRCDECNKGFYTVREYRNHYKNRHMGIRHICDVCSRSFADEYYFKRHMATHEQANIVLE